jgi:hypothetical protein
MQVSLKPIHQDRIRPAGGYFLLFRKKGVGGLRSNASLREHLYLKKKFVSRAKQALFFPLFESIPLP